MTSPSSNSSTNLMLLGFLVEGGLVILALALAWLGLSDPAQPLEELFQGWSHWRRPVLLGLAATIPMLGYLLLFHFWNPSFQRPMRQFIDLKLKPMFQGVSILEMLLLSLMAGFGEELFFRWCVQGGLTFLLSSSLGNTAAIAVSVVLASLVFGICHWVNATYGITTFLVGVYLGMLMVWTGSWLVPAIAHALYDFVALIYIGRTPVKSNSLKP